MSLLVLSLAVAMLAVERARPGRHWPEVPGWWPRVAFLNGAQALVVWLAGVTWDPWMGDARLWSAAPLGFAGGVIMGYLLITFVYYWWHRARHEVPFLWRWLHQLHHSPQRLEVVTSFYKHPLEIVANGLLSSALLYLAVGLDAGAATATVLLTGLAELFYHWNVRTPWWIGFLIQRPESHCVHHQSGLHAFNYGDLPLWDALFGTLRNPRRWQATCGFGEREHLVGRMLAGREVA